MEITNNYNEAPSLSQKTILLRNLKYQGYLPEDKTESIFDGITLKQYKKIYALMYNNKKEELNNLLTNL